MAERCYHVAMRPTSTPAPHAPDGALPQASVEPARLERGEPLGPPMQVPNHAHFIWLGSELPFVHQLALWSAREHGGFERVILHHEPGLVGTQAYRSFARDPRFELRVISHAPLQACPESERLIELFESLKAPAARANVLRIALLFSEGGVYLDTDTITIRPFAALGASHPFYCGAEHIVYPAHVRYSKHPLERGAAHTRALLRMILTAIPGGHRAFHLVRDLYPTAVNNAVIGAAAGHPSLKAMLENMVSMDKKAREVRYALGTHMIQRVVRDDVHAAHVYDPSYFYPLGPEISAHWFRVRATAPNLDAVIAPTTHTIHWYASVKTQKILPTIDPAYIEHNATRQLFSALVKRYVDLTVL